MPFTQRFSLTRGTSGGTGGVAGSINAGNVAAAQGALTTAFAKVMALGPGTHNGAKGGTATVTIATGKLAQVGIPNVKYNVVFANYSDDGALYIDGPLAITANLATQRFTYLGDLTLSGTYSAKMGIDLSIDGSSTPPKYSGTITVDGVPIPISG